MVEATRVKLVANTVKELIGMGGIHKAIDVLIAEGNGGHVSIGALTTPIVGGGAGTTIDISQPAGILNIGPTAVLIPVRFKIECEVGILAADDEIDEILIACDTRKAADGLNETTATNEQVYNMRGDVGNGLAGAVSAWSAVTSALTSAPVHTMELDRKQQHRNFGDATGFLASQFELLYEPPHPPLLTGAAHLGAAVYVDWAGTVAVSGFAQLEFVTFPKQWVYGFGND